MSEVQWRTTRTETRACRIVPLALPQRESDAARLRTLTCAGGLCATVASPGAPVAFALSDADADAAAAGSSGAGATAASAPAVLAALSCSNCRAMFCRDCAAVFAGSVAMCPSCAVMLEV